jgi:hypothetical protein
MTTAMPLGTLIVEAGQAIDTLTEKLDAAMAGGQRVAIACDRGEAMALAGRLPERFDRLPMLAMPPGPEVPVDRARVAFLPAAALFSPPPWEAVPAEGPYLRPWPLEIPFGLGMPTMNVAPVMGWAAPAALLRAVLQDPPESLDLYAVEASLARRGMAVGFLSAPAFTAEVGGPPIAAGAPPLSRDATVLAVVPHYRCEAWLPACLRSLVRQTRPLQAIAVIDDASAEPPVDIVAAFPGVTLLRSGENVGPYRLVQTIIERTRFDAYLFQDADDWSSDDRLALQLAAAERTGAELIGGQEVRFHQSDRLAFGCAYPLDAGTSLRTRSLMALLHTASLVSRDLVMRIGGFSAGMRFGADAEFQLRAHHVAHAINVRRYCYFRRAREGSLWTAAETGHASAVRRDQATEIHARAVANAERAARGEAPDVTPLRPAGPVALEHLAGPALW